MIVVVGILFWFFTAPSLRFGWGWIWGFIIMALAGLTSVILGEARLQLVRSVSRVMLILASVVLLNTLLLRWESLELLSGGYSDLLLTIRPLPTVKLRVVKIHEGFAVNVPPKEVAWDGDLPSTPYVKHHLQLRGSTLKEGFRVVK